MNSNATSPRTSVFDKTSPDGLDRHQLITLATNAYAGRATSMPGPGHSREVERAWDEFRRLIQRLLKNDTSFVRESMKELTDSLTQIQWSGFYGHSSDQYGFSRRSFASLAAHLTLATMASAQLSFRPIVVAGGGAATGKTFLLKLLSSHFGCNGSPISYSRKASIHKFIESSPPLATCFMFDEIDADRDLENTLDAVIPYAFGGRFYFSGADGEQTTGNPDSRKIVPWIATNRELAPKTGNLRERCITLPIGNSVVRGESAGLAANSDAVIRGIRLLAVATYYAGEADRIAKRLYKLCEHSECSRRVVELYSIPVGFQVAIEGGDVGSAGEWLDVLKSHLDARANQDRSR